jgi:tetratricopeptide (TPR) repeat protein
MNTFRYIIIATICFTLVGVTDGVAQASKKQKNQPAPIVNKQDASSEQELHMSEILFLDGMKYFMLEDFNQALQFFQNSLKLNPENAAIQYKIAETQLALKNPQAALSAAKIASAKEPKNAYYYLLLAQIYTEQKQFNEAALTYNNLLKNIPNSNHYLFQLADLYLSQSRYDDALKTYERIETHFGLMDQITINRQQIYLRQKNVAKAIAEGEKLLTSAPSEVRYFLAQAELYNASQMPEKGIETLEKALRIEPNNPYAHLMLSDLYRQKGNRAESENQVKLAFSTSDLDIDTKVRILVDFIRQLPDSELEGTALTLVDLTIRSHPEEAKAYAVAGDLQTIVGKKETARNNYLKAVALDDSHFKIWQQIVLLDAELSQSDSLIIHSEQALEIFPNQAVFWFYNGTGHLIEKSFAKAVKSLEYGKRLSLSEPNLIAQFNMQLGDGYNALKDFTKSDEAYEAVLAFDANNEHVLNNYSYFLSLRNVNLKKAEDMSSRLVKLFPTNPTYLDTHAWVLYKAGNYIEALKYLEQAVSLSEDATILEHYGDVLFKLGKKDEALAQWQRAKLKGETSAFLEKKIRDKKLYD